MVKVLKGGAKSRGPVVASGVTGEDEGNGGVVFRQPQCMERGSVVGHSVFPCGGDTEEQALKKQANTAR